MKPLDIIAKTAFVLAVLFVGGCTAVLIGPFLVLALILDWMRRPTFPFARWDD